MRDIRADIKKVLSWILTAALTAGFVSAAGGTAEAETMAPAGQGSVRTATASEAEKAGEEPLNEDGFLQDGDVWNDREGSGDHATPSSASPSDAEREDYPVVYAYYEKSSPEHLKFRVFVDYWQPDDKVFYSFVTRKEREDALKNKGGETALRDALLQDGRSRVREYDMQKKLSVDIPTYLEDTGLGNVPGRLYFWVENETDDKLKDIYSENNKELSELIYDLILPRVVATFGDGSEAWSGSVEKGTKIYLRVGETSYKEYDYAIQYTLDGTYPDEKKDTGAFPADLFTRDKDLIVYKPEKPIVINEDTILRAVAYPVKNGEPLALPAGYDSWIVGTWNFRVRTGKEDLYEPDNTLAEAFPVDFPTQITATVHDGNDKDFYSFTNRGYGSVRLTLTPAPYCAYGLRLMNEQGDILKECSLKPDTAWTMGESQTIIYSGEAGKGLPENQKFIVQVYSLNGTYDEDLAYTLRMVPTVYASSKGLPDAPDFSEFDMVLSHYGLKKGDQTDYTGKNSRQIQGGIFWNQVSYLSQWYGPVDEELEPYPEAALYDNKLPGSYPYRDHSASVKYHLQNAIMGISPDAGKEEYINSLKNMVYTYGGCSICYEASEAGGNVKFTDEKTGIEYKDFFLYTTPGASTTWVRTLPMKWN